MRTFKAILSYDGTDFRGWQRLPGKGRTVQGVLEAALARVLGESVEADGAGRTDAGVHALGQVASFRSPTPKGVETIKRELNALLPGDLVCLSLEEADPRFHARYRAEGKTYRYRILNAPLPDPFLRRYSLHVAEPLDEGRMRRAAERLLGRHNFQAFTNLKEKGKSFERCLESVDVSRSGDLLDLSFSGDGFLHNQVRIMAQALIDAGLGRLEPDELDSILESRDRSRAPGAAGAFGLCLMEVRYAPPGEESPAGKARTSA